MVNHKKGISLILAIVLALSSLVLVSCGKPSTLEEYVNNDSNLQEELNKMTSEVTSIKVKKNNFIFEYKQDEMELTDELEKIVKESLDKQLEANAENYQQIAKKMEDETGITGIKVIIRYSGADGVPIYEKAFSAK